MYQMDMDLCMVIAKTKAPKNEDLLRPETQNRKRLPQEILEVNTQKCVPENEDPWKCCPKTKTSLFFSSYSRLSIIRTLY